jgi:hypothetical protein
MDMFQICNTLLTRLNVRISRGLDLAKSALVTSAAKNDWSRAGCITTSGQQCDFGSTGGNGSAWRSQGDEPLA